MYTTLIQVSGTAKRLLIAGATGIDRVQPAMPPGGEAHGRLDDPLGDRVELVDAHVRAGKGSTAA
jgi:hypothetical protein